MVLIYNYCVIAVKTLLMMSLLPAKVPFSR